MHIAIGLVCLVATVLAVRGTCRAFNTPSPLVLIAVGILGSYLPFVPAVQLHPEVVLVGMLPALLYSAAIQSSLVDFNDNRRSILLLSVGLVAFTALGVGVLVHWLVPDIGWSPAIAIGAVVAPPDAVAATTIGRRIGLPRRVVTILEGESLLNDATALVALRTALAATVAWQELTVQFLVAAGGGVLVGVVGYLVVGYIRKHVNDAVLDSGLSFVTPFAAYVVAEEINASGVIAVVVAGLLLGHRSPILQSAQSRIAERMNWRAIAFLLEGTVFLLIGLQARRIISGAARGDIGWDRVLVVCAGTLVGVIVLRMLWVFAARYLLTQSGPDGDRVKPSWRYTLLLGWAGMRGVVTLAAAFILPPSTPHRNTLLLVAFTVTAGTLFVQGLSMPLLAKWLGVPGPDPMADALARANLLHQASRAGLDELESLDEDDPHDVSEMLRDRVERRDLAAWERVGLSKDETPSEVYARRRQLMIDAERQRVLEVRDTGKVAHEVVEEVLAMLDVEESMLDYTKGERQRMHSAVTSDLTSLGGCEDLREPRDAVRPKTLGQCDACLAERSPWVHLRLCLVCGNVACCDSSPNRHATRHFEETGHPVMCSAEQGEHWRWCYVHEITG